MTRKLTSIAFAGIAFAGIAFAGIAFAGAVALLAGAPAFAQVATDEAGQALARYAQLFNKGDAAALADLYSDPAGKQAAFSASIEKLRADEFGKMETYSIKTCPVAGDHARAELRFANMYTYGGVMPPGDQARVFDLVKTAAGWRIARETSVAFDTVFACAG